MAVGAVSSDAGASVVIVVVAGSVPVVLGVGVSMEMETEFGDALDLAVLRLMETPFFPPLVGPAAVARVDFFFVTRVAGRLSDTVAVATDAFVVEMPADRVAARVFTLDPDDAGNDGADPTAAAND